jgi:hypothetical protein
VPERVAAAQNCGIISEVPATCSLDVQALHRGDAVLESHLLHQHMAAENLAIQHSSHNIYHLLPAEAAVYIPITATSLYEDTA